MIRIRITLRKMRGDVEEYGRLHHAVTVDSDAVAGLQGAEHGHQVLADVHVFSQADAAEHAYQVVSMEALSSAVTRPKKFTTSW